MGRDLSSSVDRLDSVALDELRQWLSSELVALFAAEGRVRRDEMVWVTQHDVVAATLCPRSIIEQRPYVESAAGLRRRIGLFGIDELTAAAEGGHPIDNLRAARRVVGEAGELLGPQVTEWLEGLDPGGRTEVAVVAGTWLAGILDTLGRGPGHAWRWQRPQIWREWNPGGSRVLVRARPDALSTNNIRSESLGLLLVVDRTRDDHRDRLEAGVIALVMAMVGGVVPKSVSLCRVRERRVEPLQVTPPLLEAAAAAVVGAVRARAEGVRAEARPGVQCRWCALREVCLEAHGAHAHLGLEVLDGG